ncbi:MAG: transcriptional regulator, partial [Acutalibacteraceae bacterium]
PSFTTLEAICSGFGITLSQFFADGETVELTEPMRELFDGWAVLTPEKKELVLNLIKALKD